MQLPPPHPVHFLVAISFYDVYNKIEAREGDRFISELGFILKLDETKALMGYIDLLILHTDGTCEIIDFKTSSTFDKNHTVEAGRQLILYKLAIEQLYNIKVNTVSWQMLKYVDVKVGLNKQKTALRGREWVSKCSAQIRKLMSSKGYEPAYGARPIKRLMQKELVNILAKAVLDGSVHRDSDILVDVKDGQITVRNKN